MKIIHSLLAFFVGFIVSAQIYEAQYVESYEEVIKERKDSLSSNIYKIDEFSLAGLIKTEKENLNLVYVFAYWCEPCLERLPMIIKMSREYNIPLYLLNDERNGGKYMYTTKEFLEKKLKLNIPSFTYDYKKINDKGRKKRYEYFQKFMKYYMKDLYDDEYMYGYTTFLLLDEKAQLIYSNTNTPNPGDIEYDKLEELIKSN